MSEQEQRHEPRSTAPQRARYCNRVTLQQQVRRRGPAVLVAFADNLSARSTSTVRLRC